MRVVKNIKGFVTYDETINRYTVCERKTKYAIGIAYLLDKGFLTCNDYMDALGSNEIKYIKLNKGYFEVYEGRLRFYGNIQLLLD
jgi:hypothetical protein